MINHPLFPFVLCRRRSRRSAFSIVLPALLVMGASAGVSAGGKQLPAQTGTAAADGEHGQYLVERVAMCGHCHSPRSAGGEFLRSQLLAGAPIPVPPPAWSASWADFAPRIAGLNQYNDEQAIRLLTGGIARTGKALRPPMPPYRLSEQDARDIVAYLRSLE